MSKNVFSKVQEVIEKELGVRLKRLETKECYLYAFEYEGMIYLLSCNKGKYVDCLYCKAVSSDKLGLVRWDCVSVEYTPWGFYVFGTDVNELVGKLLSKLRRFLSS
ncbi:MAG: hypothetical protein DRO18_07085 [Thermoprotei archaeon]|nr:MAG: hypothetical protein DRO18_07085 [Thermoprotei archaeon]